MTSGRQSNGSKLKSELRPPATHALPNAGNKGKNVLVWAALVVVIMLGLAVLLVLPGLVSQSVETGPVEVSEPKLAEADESSRSTGQEIEKSKSDAAQAMQDFLQTRARLELANAPAWGEPEWGQALDSADQGNDLFGQREFARAGDLFEDSLELLTRLESEKDQRLANALESGWQALQADDSSSAVGYFETANAIDNDNEESIEGLERARVRPQVLHLMAAGESVRSMNQLQEARSAYSEAVELDSLYEPAAMALQQVTDEITDIAFRDAMSRALNAMDTEDAETAELALRQAAGLKPAEQVVRDAQFRLVQLQQKLWLADQRGTAARYVRDEDWSGAVKTYRGVLAKVPQAAFARQGLELAEDRERLHRQLDHYLSDPARIHSAQPLANAKKLVASAGKPPVDESRLAKKIQQLNALILEAQTPLMVTLQSDGLTSVVIYHVGRLGSFTSQQLELPPGTYTVVGSRPGYRDVRQTFTLLPGSEPPSLDIRCEEPV
jgi:predicted negative regulator of RcsB-dependent stress response